MEAGLLCRRQNKRWLNAIVVIFELLPVELDRLAVGGTVNMREHMHKCGVGHDNISIQNIVRNIELEVKVFRSPLAALFRFECGYFV